LFAARIDKEQLFNDLSRGNSIAHNENAGHWLTGSRAGISMVGHRGAIVSKNNTVIFRRPCQYCGIVET
jgi:hypothetical protein